MVLASNTLFAHFGCRDDTIMIFAISIDDCLHTFVQAFIEWMIIRISNLIRMGHFENSFSRWSDCFWLNNCLGWHHEHPYIHFPGTILTHTYGCHSANGPFNKYESAYHLDCMSSKYCSWRNIKLNQIQTSFSWTLNIQKDADVKCAICAIQLMWPTATSSMWWRPKREQQTYA